MVKTILDNNITPDPLFTFVTKLKDMINDALDTIEDDSDEASLVLSVRKEIRFHVLMAIFNMIVDHEKNVDAYTAALVKSVDTAGTVTQLLFEPIVKTLIDKGADVNGKLDGIPIISAAILRGYEYAVQELSKMDELDWKAKDDLNNTILHHLANQSEFSPTNPALKLTFEKATTKDIIDAQNKNGDTALLLAIHFGNSDTTEWLQSHGADITIANNDGEKPVDFLTGEDADSLREKEDWFAEAKEAIFDGNDENFEKYIAKMDDINQQDDLGQTLLHYAVIENDIEMVKLLLDKDVDPTIKNKFGKSPMELTAPFVYTDKGKKIQAMLQEYEDMAIFNKITNAIAEGDVEAAKKELPKLKNINIVDEDGQTLLHYANSIGNQDIAKLLMEKGADPTIKNKLGLTADKLAQGAEMLKLAKSYIETYKPPPVSEPEFENKFLRNAQKLRGFEVRAFMGAENNMVPVYVTTLPKGTLLFRGVNDISKVKEDILGIKNTPTKYCLGPHYSVYFYPFPFVDETVSAYKSVIIYQLIQDIKVACFINPCPMTRADRNIHDMPITSCDKIGYYDYGCSLTGRIYDPCFNHKFLSLNPDVVGMIGIAGQDRAAFVDKIKDDTTFQSYANKYFSAYTDSHSLYPGIPEIILYPRVARDLASVNTTLKTADFGSFMEWFNENKDTAAVAYTVYHTIPVRSRDALQKFLDEKIAAGVVHVDKTTGFFIASTDTDRPLLASSEMSRMSESFPELIFTRAQFLPGITTSGGSGRRRTFRRKH